MTSLLVRGMHGLGDNIHQRAIIRALLKRGHQITLETSWPCVYHDFDIRFARKPVALRVQLKNAKREANKFTSTLRPHHTVNTIGIAYNKGAIERTRSHTVLETMFISAGIGGEYETADMSLPVPTEWMLNTPTFNTDKPIMIYRPLVVRPEYRGASLRNAHPDQYAELVALVRDSFFVVSLADLEANREWIIGPQIKADATFNHGELAFETMAATVAKASLVFTSNGFPAVLGPAVKVPTISVQGGFEPAAWLADGARWAPYLGIDTLNPCNCGGTCSDHCTKLLDMPRAKSAIREFSQKLGISMAAETRPVSEIFTPSTYEAVSTASQPRVMPRVRVGHPSHLYQRRPPVRA